MKPSAMIRYVSETHGDKESLACAILILNAMAEDIKELKEEAGLRFDIKFKEREYEK